MGWELHMNERVLKNGFNQFNHVMELRRDFDGGTHDVWVCPAVYQDVEDEIGDRREWNDIGAIQYWGYLVIIRDTEAVPKMSF